MDRLLCGARGKISIVTFSLVTPPYRVGYTEKLGQLKFWPRPFSQLPTHILLTRFLDHSNRLIELYILASSPSSKTPTMPNPQVIPDELRGDIERRIMVEKQSYRQILQWLAGKGYIYIYRTLTRQC
jgi:hypothetical protein